VSTGHAPLHTFQVLTYRACDKRRVLRSARSARRRHPHCYRASALPSLDEPALPTSAVGRASAASTRGGLIRRGFASDPACTRGGDEVGLGKADGAAASNVDASDEARRARSLEFAADGGRPKRLLVPLTEA
jgi:hypothetical protein